MVVPEVILKKEIIKKSTAYFDENDNYCRGFLNEELLVHGYFYLFEHKVHISKTKKGFAATEPRSGFTITGYETYHKTEEELFKDIYERMEKAKCSSKEDLEIFIQKAIDLVSKRKIICYGTYLSL